MLIKCFKNYWVFMSTLDNFDRLKWLVIASAASAVLIAINKYVFGELEFGGYASLLPIIIVAIPIYMSTITPSSRPRKD